MSQSIPATQSEWRKALDELPSLEETNGKIPSIFFAHGQPMLLWDDSMGRRRFDAGPVQGGKDSLLSKFLQDFGPKLLEKYEPKAILVFSAHWESYDERLISDWDENPLLYDYYGFPDKLYQVDFKSKGDHQLSLKIQEAFKEAGMKARLIPITESRGRDGRPNPPLVQNGLDHGIFVPFVYAFPKINIPIVQVSIDSNLSPQAEWEVGKAVSKLREEGILILSGGLTVHTFQDFSAFNVNTAEPIYKEWDAAIQNASSIQDPDERRKEMQSLVLHPGFRKAHPREDHFVPLYVAAGAADEPRSGSKILAGLYGALTVAFGV